MKAVLIALGLSLLATSAMAQAPPKKLSQLDALKNPLAILQQFTLNDLQSALADANAQVPPDTLAANCYSALIKIVQANPTIGPLGLPIGAFTGFQKARDFKAVVINLQSPNGPLAGLNAACAPLVVDTQTTLLQLGLAVGIILK